MRNVWRDDFMGYWGVVMQDLVYELPRIPIPRTPVNKGIKKGIGAIVSSPDSTTHLGYYGHFFNPPGDVSLFCPGEHLPAPLRSGLPFPGPSSIAANATPDTDILSAIISAAINNVIRFLICSHLLSFFQKQNRPTSPLRR